MNKIENLDKEIEYLAHNLRGGVEDMLGIKKRTVERILGLLFTGTDMYTFSSHINTINVALFHIFILYILPEQKSSPLSNQGVKIQNGDNSFATNARLFVLALFLFHLSSGKFSSIAPILYLCQHLHNNDDRGIKNWAKGKLKELRKSIKIPGLQPSPV